MSKKSQGTDLFSLPPAASFAFRPIKGLSCFTDSLLKTKKQKMFLTKIFFYLESAERRMHFPNCLKCFCCFTKMLQKDHSLHRFTFVTSHASFLFSNAMQCTFHFFLFYIHVFIDFHLSLPFPNFQALHDGWCVISPK